MGTARSEQRNTNPKKKKYRKRDGKTGGRIRLPGSSCGKIVFIVVSDVFVAAGNLFNQSSVASDNAAIRQIDGWMSVIRWITPTHTPVSIFLSIIIEKRLLMIVSCDRGWLWVFFPTQIVDQNLFREIIT